MTEPTSDAQERANDNRMMAEDPRLAFIYGEALRDVVLQGDADPIVPLASAEDIAARVPDADLRVIPALGHSLPVALVPIFADAITAAAEA